MNKLSTHTRSSHEVLEGEIVTGRRGRMRVVKIRPWMAWLIMIGFAVLLGLLLVLILKGAGFLANLIWPVLLAAVVVVTGVLVVVGIPMAIIPKYRPTAVLAFYLGSGMYGMAAWILGFILTLQYWGVFWLIIGLLLAGIGVVPLGALAAGFAGDWNGFWQLLALFGLMLGSRYLARRLAATV